RSQQASCAKAQSQSEESHDQEGKRQEGRCQESKGQEGCQIQKSRCGSEGVQEGSCEEGRREEGGHKDSSQEGKEEKGREEAGKKAVGDQVEKEEKEGQVSVWPRTLAHPSPARRRDCRARYAGDRPGFETLAALCVRPRQSRRSQGHAVLRSGAGLECRHQLWLVPEREPTRSGCLDGDQGDCGDRSWDL